MPLVDYAQAQFPKIATACFSFETFEPHLSYSKSRLNSIVEGRKSGKY